MIQRAFPFLASCKAPKPAPEQVLRQIESASQALRISLCGVKASYIAARIGISESYLSAMRHGKRPIPEALVKPLCYATGTSLLRQFLDLQAAIALANSAETEAQCDTRLARLLERAA